MQLKEFQKAVDFLNLAIHKDNPQPKMYSLMASALRQLDRNDLADEYQRKADEAQPQASSGN
jgi:Flp pilus assembly protein TadD